MERAYTVCVAAAIPLYTQVDMVYPWPPRVAVVCCIFPSRHTSIFRITSPHVGLQRFLGLSPRGLALDLTAPNDSGGTGHQRREAAALRAHSEGTEGSDCGSELVAWLVEPPLTLIKLSMNTTVPRFPLLSTTHSPA